MDAHGRVLESASPRSVSPNGSHSMSAAASSTRWPVTIFVDATTTRVGGVQMRQTIAKRSWSARSATWSQPEQRRWATLSHLDRNLPMFEQSFVGPDDSYPEGRTLGSSVSRKGWRILGVDMAAQWSDRAISVVSEWQERAYGELAEDLGFGWDPLRAFQELSPPQAPAGDYRLSVARLRDSFGRNYLPTFDWQQVEKYWDEYKRNYYYVNLPTKYENPNIYSNALANLTALTSAIKQAMPGHLDKVPIIASLPSGELNAKIRAIRGTNEVVILLQQGLASFLYHFSNIVACFIPSDLIKSRTPVPSMEHGNPGDVNHVTYATRYLVKLITAYVVEGNLYLLGGDPELRGRALYNQGIIGISMRQFPICHELMHLVNGHLSDKNLSKDKAWEREFLADQEGSTFVAALSDGADRGSPATSVWACSLALAGFQMLEEWVAYLNTGSWVIPENATHPSHRQRRENLREYQYRSMVSVGNNEDARSLLELFDKGDAVLAGLRNRIDPYLEDLRKYGAKPSPIWRVRQIPKENGDY